MLLTVWLFHSWMPLNIFPFIWPVWLGHPWLLVALILVGLDEQVSVICMRSLVLSLLQAWNHSWSPRQEKGGCVHTGTGQTNRKVWELLHTSHSRLFPVHFLSAVCLMNQNSLSWQLFSMKLFWEEFLASPRDPLIRNKSSEHRTSLGILSRCSGTTICKDENCSQSDPEEGKKTQKDPMPNFFLQPHALKLKL